MRRQTPLLAPLLLLILVGRLAAAIEPEAATQPASAPAVTEAPAAPNDVAPRVVTPSSDPSLAPLELPPSLEEHPREERSWYGYQLIVTDLISLGFAAGGAALISSNCGGTESSPLCGAGQGLAFVGGFGLGILPAIVHWQHDDSGAAWGSLGLRLALPLLVALIAFVATPNQSGSNGQNASNAPEVASTIALLVGAAIDDAFLSYDTISESRSRNH